MTTKADQIDISPTKLSHSRGFTLVEMLIVLALIGLVATLAIGNLGGLFGKGKESIAQTWVESTGPGYINTWSAFGLAEGKSYPSTLQQLMTDKVVTSEKKLKDPWGKLYQYKVPGTRNADSYDLWTITPDGKQIGNWD